MAPQNGQTALFGGTFNPVHNGHMAILTALKQLPGVTNILVLTTNIPPHKAAAGVSFEHRFKMCQLAFAGQKQVTVSNLEQRLGGKNYTLCTLQALLQQGVEQPWLAIGGDSLRDFEQWFCYREILKLCRLAVCPRAGVEPAAFERQLGRLRGLGATVAVLSVQPPQISSTKIRALAVAKKPLEGLVPPAVEAYIKLNGLYQNPAE